MHSRTASGWLRRRSWRSTATGCTCRWPPSPRMREWASAPCTDTPHPGRPPGRAPPPIVQRMVDHLTEADSAAGTATEALRQFLTAVIADRHDMLLPSTGGPAVQTDRTRGVQSALHAAIRQLLQRGVRDGTIQRQVDVGDVAWLGATLAQPGRVEAGWDEISLRLLDTYLAGLRFPRSYGRRASGCVREPVATRGRARAGHGALHPRRTVRCRHLRTERTLAAGDLLGEQREEGVHLVQGGIVDALVLAGAAGEVPPWTVSSSIPTTASAAPSDPSRRSPSCQADPRAARASSSSWSGTPRATRRRDGPARPACWCVLREDHRERWTCASRSPTVQSGQGVGPSAGLTHAAHEPAHLLRRQG